MFRLWAVLALSMLAACGNQPSPAGTAPTSAAAIAATAAGTPAPAAPTASAAQAGDAAIPSSLTPEGYHVFGRPDAPVTLVMYSDFL